MTAPLVTGMVVDRTGHFAFAFLIAAVMSVAGIVAFGVIVRRIEPIDWHASVAVDQGGSRAHARTPCA